MGVCYYASINFKELLKYKDKNISEFLTFLYKKSIERRIPKQEIKLPKWISKFIGE